MKKLIIATAAVLLLIAASCKSSSNSQSSSYYPMATGDVWNHVLTMTTVERGPYDTTYTVVDSTTDTTVSDTTIAGMSAWKLKTTTKGQSSYGYMVVTSSEVAYYSTPTDTMPTKVLALPLTQNATWIVDSMRATGKVKATVLDQENVTVPAGTYNAWKVQQVMDSEPTMPIDEWFGKGIGEAKWSLNKTQVMEGETLTLTETDVMTSATIH